MFCAILVVVLVVVVGVVVGVYVRSACSGWGRGWWGVYVREHPFLLKPFFASGR